MPPEVSERIFTQVLVFHETYQAVGVWLMEHLEPIGNDLPLLDWLGLLRILVLVNRPNQAQKTLISLAHLGQIEEELLPVRGIPLGMPSPDP